MPKARIAIALATLFVAMLSVAQSSSGSQSRLTHSQASTRQQRAAKQYQLADLRQAVQFYRQATWHWQAAVERPRTSSSYIERRVRSFAYLKWAVRLWQGRWHHVKRYAQSIFDSRGYLPPNKARLLGRYLAARQGWAGKQWDCLDQLWGTRNGQTLESGWSTTADNPYSEAHGIPQANPGSKMAKFGHNWWTSAYVQIRWGLYYVLSKYHTPCEALSVRLHQGSY